MPDLFYQKWCEADFASDTFVTALPWAAQNAWRCLLQKMWLNHGWLPADDHKLARMLGCDVRTWRSIKALLSPGLLAEVDPFIGPIYRQSRVRDDWDEATELQAKAKERTAPARAERSKKAKERRSVTVKNGHDRNSNSNSDSNRVRHALARKPEPEEPSSKGDDGSGPLPPPTPAAPSRGLEGRSGVSPVSALAGPFVPAEPIGPKPAGKPAFLAAYEAAGGDLTKMPERKPAPTLTHASNRVDAQSVWDKVNQKFVPASKPPPMTDRARAVIQAAGNPDPQPQEEQHHDERQPDPERRDPDDDDITDFLKF